MSSEDRLDREDRVFAAALAETTQSLICVYDREGRIVRFNRACEQATGYAREEVLGRDAREVVIPPEEADEFGPFLADVWATGRPGPGAGRGPFQQPPGGGVGGRPRPPAPPRPPGTPLSGAGRTRAGR